MKKLYINTLILFSPFLLMVMVNEVVRPTLVEVPFQYTKSFDLSGLTQKVVVSGSGMNPGKMKKEECTWYCHNHNSYCVNFHKKISFHQYIGDLYNDIITLLKQGGYQGSYAINNIIFLVILWPLIMFFLLTKSLDLQRKINKLKR